MTRLDGTLAHARKVDKGDATTAAAAVVAKKRKSPPQEGQEEESSRCRSDEEDPGLDSSALPSRTKRSKTEDQEPRELLPTMTGPISHPSLPGPSMVALALAPTPAAWPPALPPKESPGTLSFPSPNANAAAAAATQQELAKQQQTSFSSSTSESHSRHPSDGSAASPSTTNTSLTSSAGLLTWREKAKYLTIAQSIWTR